MAESMRDNKYQEVRTSPEASEGTWEMIIHDCITPNLAEIKTQKAAVGTIWSCANCSDKWKLLLLSKTRSFVGTDDVLQWVRITPKGEDGE